MMNCLNTSAAYNMYLKLNCDDKCSANGRIRDNSILTEKFVDKFGKRRIHHYITSCGWFYHRERKHLLLTDDSCVLHVQDLYGFVTLPYIVLHVNKSDLSSISLMLCDLFCDI
jgi:hypothetical protein